MASGFDGDMGDRDDVFGLCEELCGVYSSQSHFGSC